MNAARDIENRAARWLIRREESEWSVADQTELDAWLDESMAHKAAYWRLEHGWREADRIGALGAQSQPNESRIQSSVFSWWKPMAIAASLLVVVGVGVREFQSPPPPTIMQMQFRTPIGDRKLVSLPDGSKIEMNTATVMRTDVTADQRQVWLDKGEAYFEVAHMEGHPFVVHAGIRTVTVLGTKFSVRRDGDKVTVSVVEGRVQVEDTSTNRSSRSSIITAGDVAIASGPSTLLAPRSEERVENALAWRDGMLNFDQATLGEAVAEFNRYNTKPIIITDPDIAAIRIGGTFQASNVDAFIRLLHDAYGLRIKNDADSVKISS